MNFLELKHKVEFGIYLLAGDKEKPPKYRMVDDIEWFATECEEVHHGDRAVICMPCGLIYIPEASLHNMTDKMLRFGIENIITKVTKTKGEPNANPTM